MRKAILLLSAVLSYGASSAQVVLPDAENYEIGMKMLCTSLTDLDTAATEITTTGENVTWNFNDLTVTMDTFTTRIIHPDSSVYGSTFPTASYAMVNDGVVYMIQKAGNTNEMVGVIPSSSGLVIEYNNPYTFVQRPLTYADTLRDTATRYYAVSGENYSGWGTGITVVDGWGTLVVPGHTYGGVLRARYHEKFYDTGAISGVVTESNITSYNWFDANHISPLLRIDSIIVSNPLFSDTTVVVWMLTSEEIPLSVNDHGALPASKLYYADGSLYLQGALKHKDKITVRVYDMMGRKVMENTETLKGDMKKYSLSINELDECMQYTASVIIERGGERYKDVVKVVK